MRQTMSERLVAAGRGKIDSTLARADKQTPSQNRQADIRYCRLRTSSSGC
jgi:hypothetical protein